MAPGINNNVELRFGSVLVGCCMDILLQGMLCVQFNHYFHQYPGDRRFMKLAVAGLILLTTLKSMQSFVMLWVEFIDAYADADLAFTELISHWSLQGNPVMVAALGSYVRAYFCYRLFSISRAWWAVALVTSIDLASLIFISIATYLVPDTSNHDEVLVLYSLHFSVVFVGDTLLTFLTAFFLTRSKKGLLPRTHGIINRLIWLTFQTAAPGAICSLINLIVSQLSVYQLFATFNEILPKLYAFSMMWTLNARNELRGIPWGNRSTLSYIDPATNSRLGARQPVETTCPEEFELHRLGNDLQIHTDFHVDNAETIGTRNAPNA